MKYTKEERLDIGRRIYDGEIGRYEAAEQYGINDQTARSYMTKEQLIQELVKARITEARLKKGYEVKGDGTVILYGNRNTK